MPLAVLTADSWSVLIWSKQLLLLLFPNVGKPLQSHYWIFCSHHFTASSRPRAPGHMWPHWAKFPKVLHIYDRSQIFWGGRPIVCWTLEILPTIVTVGTGFKQSWKSGPYLGTKKRTKLSKNMSVYLVTEQ